MILARFSNAFVMLCILSAWYKVKKGFVQMSGDLTQQQMVESEAIWGGPAYYANRSWVVTLSGGMIRITFAEQGGPEETPRYRTAIALSAQDAVAFADLIESVVQPLRAAVAKAQQAPPEE